MTKQLILVDGSSYFYRAFHALPPLTNSKGHPTGAIYGVVNMLKRLIKDYAPTHMAVIFDAKGKTFRDDLYKEYKANREAMPDSLVVQKEPLMNIVEAMGLPLLEIAGVEADDVIGTLARAAEKAGWQTIISTGDKDMAQLVGGHITLINTMTNKRYDIEGVKEKFGILPEQMIDYLTLIGDKVDNVPGVDKVGPKTAVKWLELYGTLDGIIEHANEIKGKVGENLREAIPYLALSKQLVTIKCDCQLSLKIDELNITPPESTKLAALYQELEFKTWLNDILQMQADKPVSSEVNQKTSQYQIILDEGDFAKFVTQLKTATVIAVDTETDGLEYMSANLVGLSISMAPCQGVYIPFGHDYPEAPKQLSRKFVLEQLEPILSDERIKKIGQNIKFDYQILKRHGVNLAGIAFDTMLESYIINSIQARHDMDSLALKYLGQSTISFEEVAGHGKNQKTFNQVEIIQAGQYAAEDADVTFRLHDKMYPMLMKSDGMNRVFKDIEMPLVRILAELEMTGVLIDCDKLREQSKTLGERIATLEDSAYALAGQSFNMNSPKQLQELLYVNMGLPVVKKTPKGQPSTAEPVLQELAYDYELPKIILEYRSLSKLKSTYIDALPKQINEKTGRVHTSYNQAVTATGRLSSTSPNLQNIPVRTEEGRKVRRAFIAPAGKRLVAADYSQIELRIMAHLSRDRGLLQAFSDGHDIHSATAAEIFGTAIDKVEPEHRRRAKAINFGLIYGMSAFGLAKQIGVERHLAEEYIDVYFKRYPGVKDYMERTREQAHKDGFVETLCGRRLYLPDINTRNIPRQKAAERAAINAPMQGTAADIIKLAMIQVDAWLRQSTLDATMLMQVHDELVFEVAKHDLDQFVSILPNKMTNVLSLDVPLEVGIGIGLNWDEAH